MAVNSQIDGTYKRHIDDQIIVALPHVDIVKAELNKLEILYECQDDPALGLAQLVFTNLSARIGVLRSNNAQLVSDAEAANKPALPAGPVDDLDLLMYKLRRDSRDARGGWVPTIGKNRWIDGTEAFGEINGGGRKADPFGENYTTATLIPDGTFGDLVRIGVMDTEILDHPEFIERRVAFKRVPAPADAPEMAAHGAFGVGLILKHVPGAQLTVRPVLNPAGRANAWDTAKRMMTFLQDDPPVHILHMPWGGITDDGAEPLLLATAIERLSHHGIVLLAAAGNFGDSKDPSVPPTAAAYPAAHPLVVGVGAANADGTRARFSPDPSKLPWIRACALGVGQESFFFGGRALWEGTSFALANFTGILARRAQEFGGDVHKALAQLLAEGPPCV